MHPLFKRHPFQNSCMPMKPCIRILSKEVPDPILNWPVSAVPHMFPRSLWDRIIAHIHDHSAQLFVSSDRALYLHFYPFALRRHLSRCSKVRKAQFRSIWLYICAYYKTGHVSYVSARCVWVLVFFHSALILCVFCFFHHTASSGWLPAIVEGVITPVYKCIRENCIQHIYFTSALVWYPYTLRLHVFSIIAMVLFICGFSSTCSDRIPWISNYVLPFSWLGVPVTETLWGSDSMHIRWDLHVSSTFERLSSLAVGLGKLDILNSLLRWQDHGCEASSFGVRIAEYTKCLHSPAFLLGRSTQIMLMVLKTPETTSYLDQGIIQKSSWHERFFPSVFCVSCVPCTLLLGEKWRTYGFRIVAKSL